MSILFGTSNLCRSWDKNQDTMHIDKFFREGRIKPSKCESTRLNIGGVFSGRLSSWNTGAMDINLKKGGSLWQA